MFGFAPAEPFIPTRWLADGDTVLVGRSSLAVRHCPGHTPGHVVFTVPTHSARLSATCCLPAASAAPISLAVTTAR